MIFFQFLSNWQNLRAQSRLKRAHHLCPWGIDAALLNHVAADGGKRELPMLIR